MVRARKNTDIDDKLEENIPTIKFMRKKIKYRAMLFLRIVTFVTIPVVTSIIFSNIIFNSKYKALIDKVNNEIENNDFSKEYSDAINNVKDSLVTIGASKEDLESNRYIDSNATGIILQDNGRILTNYSVVKNLSEIYVNLSFVGSEPLKAEIIVSNEDADMAIIQVDSDETLTPIKFASKEEIIEGEKVLLISNLTADEYIDNLIPGIITSANRQINMSNKEYKLFEVNTPINKFNDGGVIVNLKGEVIAIASRKITDAMNINGLYYALDLISLKNMINYANEINDILGILEGDYIKGNSVEQYTGLYVTRVKSNSNEYKSGLRPTDIIFEVEDEKINNVIEILEMLKNKENGDTVTCKVMRSGEIIDVDIVLSNIDK
ncbi:MAG: serine protease [Clostridium sartagoforme]|nr:serine protease [Clostridium sartagoforme]